MSGTIFSGWQQKQGAARVLLRKLCGLTILLLVLSAMSAEARTDKFDFFVVPTVDDKLDSWLKMPSKLQPTIHLVDTVYPNQPFSLRILFKGYGLSTLRNAHITYDVQFFDPAGKPTEDRGENLLGYHGPVVRNSNPHPNTTTTEQAINHESLTNSPSLINKNLFVIINQQLLKVYFDDTYPAGDYEIKVIATDQLTQKVVSKSRPITLAPFARAGNFASADFFSFWLRNHFRQPDIAKAVFGVLQFFENDLDWMKQNIYLLSFINVLLDDNRWIWDHLVKLYDSSAEDRKTIIALMALNNYRIPALVNSFNEEQKSWAEQVANFTLPSTEGRIEKPEQIDALWGHFYATGHLQPVEKIVKLIGPPVSAKAPGNVDEERLSELAFISLVDNGKEIPLLVNYCVSLLEHGNISGRNKAQLRVALDLIQKYLEETSGQNPAAGKKMPLPLTR